MDIKTKALLDAIKRLDVLGARYHIVTETGDVYGEPIQPQRPVHRRGQGPLEPFKQRINALNPGESMFLECSSDIAPTMQNHACGHMNRVFGKGNYTTSRCADGIEVLVLGRKEQEPQPTEPYQAPIFVNGTSK